ncbi:tRNA (adenine22-N1)-methyltransferase [Entomoplasma ellychniae]|uniref:tRNA (Adenine22-N1)-methyltransferase n=1 Tax=Entomoplasma ellychniae TaxID=2114 RepID=A0A8E2QWN6_9MOLU|nr:class I SAM-dependent methyltransferase [Entomoplasma ellychniae]PPE05061.1 tRNA (adenine22-N1)-methyltransferase [Entomoplasma ellychniae]
MLSKRLSKVADLINDCNNVADIGTDHAYLPIFLVQNSKAKCAFAIDVNSEPLAEALKNIQLANLTNKITTIKSNGFDFINNKDISLDVVTICGLGSPTIVNILSSWKKPQGQIIVCSNTEVSPIRQWAFKNNFEILFEDFFVDQKKHYWLLQISTEFKSSILKKDLLLGNKNYFINNQNYLFYLNNEINKYKSILLKLNKKNHSEQYKKTVKKIKLIEGYVNAINKIS